MSVMMSKRRWAGWCGLGLLLLTAGCFRPAGESVVDLTPGGAVDAAVAVDEPTLAAPTPGEPTVMDAATAPPSGFSMELVGTLPPSVTDVPTSSIAAPVTGGNGAPPITLIPLGGAAGSAATPTPAPVIVTLANITLTPMFITPGAPLAPITLEPGAPLPGLDGGGVLPTATPSGLITPTSLPGTGDDCLYIIQPGDSLYQIALNEGVTLADLRAANPDLVGEAPILQIGQQITLPDCGTAPDDDGTIDTIAVPLTPVVPSTSLTGSAAGGTPVPTGGNAASGTALPPGTEEYVVRPGDTLYGIGLRFGVTVQELINANVGRLADPNRLQVGDRLLIPADN